MSLQLLNSFSKFQLQDSDNSEVRIIKGFASTTGIENVDRSGEFVKSPFEFDLVTFKNSPQLLLDHDYIKTREGNSVAAGKVTKAIPAYIKSENPDNPDEWVVHSLSTDEFVSFWPKEKSAVLKENSQGLFIVAEVFNDFAIGLVDRGEVGTFSWRGFARSEQVGQVNALKHIDVLEISMVHTQCEKSSTFMLVDDQDETHNLEIDFTDCEVCSLQFSKNVHTFLDVQQYVKQFDLNIHTISENTEDYFVNFGRNSLETAKTFKFCTSEGCTILAAPVKQDTIQKIPIEGIPDSQIILENKMENENVKPATLLLADLETIKRLPNLTIEKQKDILLEDQPAELYTVIVEEVAENVEPVAEPVAEQVEEPVVEPVAETVEPVVEEPAVEPTVSVDERVLEALEALNAKVTSLETEVSDSKAEKEALEKQISDLNTELKNQKVSSSKQKQQDRLDAVLKSLTPTQEPRQERQKSADVELSQDENIFKSIWGVTEENI